MVLNLVRSYTFGQSGDAHEACGTYADGGGDNLNSGHAGRLHGPTLNVRSLPRPLQLSAQDALTPQTLLQIQRTNRQLTELTAYHDQQHRVPLPPP
jgi:hypothetical protein